MKLKKIFNKKTILSGLIASLSFKIFFGTVLGYFAAKFFSGEETGDPAKFIFRSFRFNLGKYKIHLHHWLVCIGILTSVFIWSYFPLSQLSFGFLGGAIYQGISCYEDWKKILTKTKK